MRRKVWTAAELDELALPPERGPNGEPSDHDFQVYELLRGVEQFAVEFDSMVELIPGRPDYRVLITAGLLVPRFAVTGQLASDGAIKLVRLRLDLEAGWE